MNTKEQSEEYTEMYHTKCLTDASDVTHTVTYQKASDRQMDDVILQFHCSRDSKCVKCYQNYL